VSAAPGSTNKFILALDAGTTSSRSLLFDAGGRIVALAQREFTQHFPQPGWVEHNAVEIWETQRATIAEALHLAHATPRDIAAVGITNQRETTVLWDRATGEPVSPAIVWQDRRTAGHCERMRADGLEAEIAASTGLLLDPYFSGTKLAWLLHQVPGARARAERGELAFGTIDSWLLYKLTGHRRHVTDVTNASRTLLMDLRAGNWSDRLLGIFGVPHACLPEIVDSCLDSTAAVEIELDGVKLPVTGIAGDQQSALFGQACFTPGMAKNTYGTGCFALMNTGNSPQTSRGP
jgi:glycerol kinase